MTAGLRSVRGRVHEAATKEEPTDVLRVAAPRSLSAADAKKRNGASALNRRLALY